MAADERAGAGGGADGLDWLHGEAEASRVAGFTGMFVSVAVVETALAEVTVLRARLAAAETVLAAADELRERVRAWGAVPFRGPGHEEEYDLANNIAEDAILVAADAYDAARPAAARPGEE